MVQYTDKQKVAYYKRKAAMVANPQKKQYPKKKSYKYKYPGLGRSIGRAAGSMIGNAVYPGVGGVVGGALGSVVGQGAHATVKRITGFGDYHVSQNSLVYNRDAVPEFSVNNERCTMVVHREFISDIIGSTTFNIQSYRINPGIVSTFPWLAAIAENYEQYVIQGMIFEYKTTCATAVSSTNTALGTVVMATQYNSLSPAFTSKQQMENYEFSQSSVPSASILHAIECDPQQTQCGGIFNVADQPSTPGDIRLYDIGRFNIATVGMQAAATIGELWVSYKICFLKPKLVTNSESTDLYQQTNLSSLSTMAPYGALITLSPSVYNTGVVTPISTNDWNVDVNFVGILQCCITYKIAVGTTSLTTGYWSATGGSGTTDVTGQFSGIIPTSGMSTNIVLTPVVTTIAYFRFEGGVDSSGNTPYISLANYSITGSGFNSCYIFFNSISSDFYNGP